MKQEERKKCREKKTEGREGKRERESESERERGGRGGREEEKRGEGICAYHDDAIDGMGTIEQWSSHCHQKCL